MTVGVKVFVCVCPVYVSERECVGRCDRVCVCRKCKGKCDFVCLGGQQGRTASQLHPTEITDTGWHKKGHAKHTHATQSVLRTSTGLLLHVHVAV